jgi:phosphohistidine swiveling domain-containing protein
MNSRKIVFSLHEGKGKTPKLLGGKGYGLAVMADLGIPVPPALTITTTVSRSFRQYGTLPKRLSTQLHDGLRVLEEQTGKRIGDADRPLLVSVRSGAAVSMPGMMDTILNLGMTPQIAEALAEKVGEAVAYDWYERFITMFSETVFDASLKGVDTGNAKDNCEALRMFFQIQTGQAFPDDPMVQLSLAINAVLRSWNSARAKVYRKEYKIPDWLGTAVNIQAMVFGNLDEQSGTGVVFSRNVATGERGIYGEWMLKAQGEDIVAGIRTPSPISEMAKWNHAIYRQLEQFVLRLEDHINDVVDVEFTVESGRLFILQVRSAKRTPEAALTIATQMVWDGRWTKEDALLKWKKVAKHATRPSFDKDDLKNATVLTDALAASPGCVTGYAVFSSEKAMERKKGGFDAILVRPDTSPEDLSGMLASVGIVTATGGLTSHAAVVARGLGRPCIVGADAIEFYGNYIKVNGTQIDEGDVISIDGTMGKVYEGRLRLNSTGVGKKEINIFLKWVRETEPPAPAPRIDFDWMMKKSSENLLLNEFYLADAMAREAEGTPFGDDLMVYRNEIHWRTAEHLACYVAVAVAGELRHSWDKVRGTQPSAGCGCPICAMQRGVNYADPEGPGPEARKRLNMNFGITRGVSRATTQTKVIEHLRTLSNEQLVEFFEMATAVFGELPWEGGYGGKNWAQIARSPIQYLKGEVNHTLFADHVFDLEHNNGSVFGKHAMFNGDRERIKRQLNEKKKASGVRDLYARLAPHASFSYPTLDFYNKGAKNRVW